MSLLKESCVACQAGAPPVQPEERASLGRQIPEWSVIDTDGVPKLQRVFRFENFLQALAFTNRVGALAEEHNHHPTLLTEWGKVTVTWWTHKIQNLHKNDYILAAHCDRTYAGE